jgi:hypothetical protein
MIIIQTNSITSISVPSRQFTGDVDLAIQDEQLRSTSSAMVTATYSDGLMNFDYDFQGVESRYYFVIATQGDNELVKWKMFCTNQTDLQNYSISEGEYVTPPQSNNDFIVLD